MEAPQRAVYPSRDELITAAKSHAARHHYAITIRTSKPGRVWLKCDRGGSYRNRLDLNDNTRKRTTGSRLINCPFSVTGTQLINGSWQLSVPNAAHNHEIASSLLAHPSLRRLDQDQMQSVRQMTKAGQAPRIIRATLEAEVETDVHVTLQDLYNIRKQIRREELGARTPIQALVDQLATSKIFHRYQTDSEGHITHLFIAHPRLVKIYR